MTVARCVVTQRHALPHATPGPGPQCLAAPAAACQKPSPSCSSQPAAGLGNPSMAPARGRRRCRQGRNSSGARTLRAAIDRQQQVAMRVQCGGPSGCRWRARRAGRSERKSPPAQPCRPTLSRPADKARDRDPRRADADRAAAGDDRVAHRALQCASAARARLVRADRNRNVLYTLEPVPYTCERWV